MSASKWAELVEELKVCASDCNYLQNSFDLHNGSVMFRAADAIEQLLAENERLKAERKDVLTVLTNDMVSRRMYDNVCEQRDALQKERDAAAEVIRSILQHEDIDLCMLCEYGNAPDAKCTEFNGRDWCLKSAKWIGTKKSNSEGNHDKS